MKNVESVDKSTLNWIIKNSWILSELWVTDRDLSPKEVEGLYILMDAAGVEVMSTFRNHTYTKAYPRVGAAHMHSIGYYVTPYSRPFNETICLKTYREVVEELKRIINEQVQCDKE